MLHDDHMIYDLIAYIIKGRGRGILVLM